MSIKEKPLTAEQQSKFAYIYAETHSQVQNHVRRVVRHEHDSEDVAMDVFIKIQKLIKNPVTTFDENKSSLSTWVHTVTNSVILDFFRTNHQDHYKAVSDFIQNDATVPDSSPFQFVSPAKADSEILNAELHSRIAKAFRTLKPKYRKIAILFFLRDLPYVEIAEIVDVPMGTVKGMLSRARQKLQTELDGLYNFKAVNVQNVEA
jgi:RNA polymerase sigma-70 factor (ECF subfamily)